MTHGAHPQGRGAAHVVLGLVDTVLRVLPELPPGSWLVEAVGEHGMDEAGTHGSGFFGLTLGAASFLTLRSCSDWSSPCDLGWSSAPGSAPPEEGGVLGPDICASPLTVALTPSQV